MAQDTSSENEAHDRVTLVRYGDAVSGISARGTELGLIAKESSGLV